MKKFLALLLAIVMMLSVASFTVAEEELEEYRVTYVYPGISDGWSTDDYDIGKIIYDKFKIALDYVPFTGDWTEYCSLRLAGGDYPEIMRLDTAEMTQAYIDAGALLSYDDYADIMPDFFSFWDDFVYDTGRSHAADGKLYYCTDAQAIPNTASPAMQFIVRSDLLEEQGWPNPYTASEWLDFFKTAKENHPTTEDGVETFINLPLGESWGYNTLFNETATTGHIIKKDYSTYTCVDTWDDFEEREFMEFFNALWRANLLDPESFTDKTDQMIAKANTTQSLSGWYGRWLYGPTNNAFIDAGTPQYQYVEMTFRIDSMADTPRPCVSQAGGFGLGFGDRTVTNNCKDPERLMALVNYMYSDEGYVLQSWGVEGVDWYLNPETGRRDATPQLIDMYLNDPDAFEQRGFSKFQGFMTTCGNNLSVKDRNYGAIAYCEAMSQVTYTDRVIEAAQKTAGQPLPWNLNMDGVLPCGYVYVNDKGINSVSIPVEREDLKDIQDDVQDYTYSMIPKIIMAESDAEFNALYDECVAVRKEKGIDTLVDWYNEQFQAAVEAYDAAN